MKKLLLASQAENVINQLITLLPKSPEATRVLYVTTAAKVYDNKPWLEADRKGWIDNGFELVEYDISGKSQNEIESAIEDIDIIYVTGGNSFYLLQETRKSGFDNVLIAWANSGKWYAGGSAGAVLVGPTIEPFKRLDDSSIASELDSYDGIGLVDFVVFPHYGVEKYLKLQQEIEDEWQNSNIIFMPLSNNQAVIIEGDMHRIIES